MLSVSAAASRRRVRFMLLIGLSIGVVFLIGEMRGLAGQLVLALLLSALAAPLAKRIEKQKSRAFSAGAAVSAVVIGALGLVGLLTPPLFSQLSLLISQAPQLLEDLQRILRGIARQEWARTLGLNEDALRQGLSSAAQWAGNSLPMLAQGIGAGLDAVSRAFLSPVLAYYFVRDREAFCYQLSLWIPLAYRKRVLTALKEMRREAGGYARGQLLICGAVAALTAAGLLIVGIPAWLALGLLMGICELIPYLGPMIGGVPIALAALPLGWSKMLFALGMTVLVQQIEGSFLSPRLMAGATGLHPVYVLALLSVGNTVGGLFGMVTAVPLFVCVRGAYRVLYAAKKAAE